jgi:hypothetical protein
MLFVCIRGKELRGPAMLKKHSFTINGDIQQIRREDDITKIISRKWC